MPGRRIREEKSGMEYDCCTAWRRIRISFGRRNAGVVEFGVSPDLSRPFYGELREVKMEGEICFDVARKEEQPFVVRTADLAVKSIRNPFQYGSLSGGFPGNDYAGQG